MSDHPYRRAMYEMRKLTNRIPYAWIFVIWWPMFAFGLHLRNEKAGLVTALTSAFIAVCFLPPAWCTCNCESIRRWVIRWAVSLFLPGFILAHVYVFFGT